MLIGEGSNATTLQWPNASGGITFTAGNNKNTFHLRELTLTTSQVGSGIGLNVIGLGGNNGQFVQSDIANVVISGDDIGPSTPTLHYWGAGIKLHNWPDIDISNVMTYGPHQAPGSAGGGIGLIYEGNAGTSSYAVLLNISRSSFNFHTTGIQLNDFWQGITCDQCNFNGELGGSCISQTGGATGVLVLFTLTNSQLNCAGTQVSISSSVINPTFMGNTFTVFSAGNSAINTGTGASGLIVIGNEFNLAGAPAGTFGVVYGGAGGVVLGNIFNAIGTPVNLTAASTNTGVSQNRYAGGAGANINNGAGNQLGVISQ
jgi:hypothetical protein